MEILSVTNISLVEQGNTVLQPISFIQHHRQNLAVAGASGAGKSTLLQLIAGLIQPSTGEIYIGGRRVRGPAETLVPGHSGVAYLSQKFDLPHSLRVEQVLRYANKQSIGEAHTLYELCNISHLASRRTDQLSGGEQQRVALARLLLGSPQLLLLDEPFSNLDRVHKQELQAVIQNLSDYLNITCILVSHEATDMLAWADEILVLQQGRVIQQATPQQVYYQPATEYVAALFGDYNLLRGADLHLLASARYRVENTTLLVRPEQLHLASEGSGLPGTVQLVRFLGSYYEVLVKTAETTLCIKTNSFAFAKGDVVTVSLAMDGGWAI